jgi:hypothetical protein
MVTEADTRSDAWLESRGTVPQSAFNLHVYLESFTTQLLERVYDFRFRLSNFM